MRSASKYSVVVAMGLVAVAVVLMAGMPAFAGGTSIQTGALTTVDGHLEVKPDAYGSWAQPFAGGVGPNDDRYNPVGAATTSQQVGFMSTFWLFAGGGTQRAVLSDNADLLTTYPGGLAGTITSPNAAYDFSGDGINDTLTSAFNISGGGTNLDFTLLQRVRAKPGSVSYIRQRYTMTNSGVDTISGTLVRNFDGDLLWTGDFTNDEVGTTFNGSGLATYAFEREPGAAGRGVTLSSAQADAYWGCKNGVTHPLGLPACGFGTDFQIWDNFGLPTSWENFIPVAGYDTNGVSGASPPGSIAPRDAHIGLSFPYSLAPGASMEFDVIHTYGASAPIPEPATIVLLGLGGLIAARRGRRG